MGSDRGMTIIRHDKNFCKSNYDTRIWYALPQQYSNSPARICTPIGIDPISFFTSLHILVIPDTISGPTLPLK